MYVLADFMACPLSSMLFVIVAMKIKIYLSIYLIISPFSVIVKL